MASISLDQIGLNSANFKQNAEPIANSTESLPPSNNEKATRIFDMRASDRSTMRTCATIKCIAVAILILICIGAIAAGIAFGIAGTLPIAAVCVLVVGGSVIGSFGALSIPTKRILTDAEEQTFWQAISVDNLTTLTSKRWNWYCLGAPYYGPVAGVCTVAYFELENNGIMDNKTSKSLQALLDAYEELERRQAAELSDLQKVKPGLLIPDAQQKIIASYTEPKLKLENEFETFRQTFIDQSYQTLCTKTAS